MTYKAGAITSAAGVLLCLAAIPLYGVTHEGTTTDQLIVWGLVALGFVLLGVFAYCFAGWSRQ